MRCPWHRSLTEVGLNLLGKIFSSLASWKSCNDDLLQNCMFGAISETTAKISSMQWISKKYIFLINSICIQQLEKSHGFCNCHFANCWFPCMKSICRIWQIFFALCEWTNSELIYFTITNLPFWLIRYSLNKVCCIITQGTVKINRLNLLASPTYLLNLKLLFNKMG